jgi:D-alanyl-D-alanine carboxypeptidase
LQLFIEEPNCVDVDAELNYYKRTAKLHPEALLAWLEMVQEANYDNVQLFICSAFRSYEYQANLIKRKLERGLDINNIITILAPPGFSEHHTGRAIDIITTGLQELDQSFENTNAFAWLSKNAKKFNFKMSYPKNNPFGIIYEPWHWCYQL